MINKVTILVSAILLIFSISALNAQNTKDYEHRYDPPWDTMQAEGTLFIGYGIDNAPDFHGHINNPDLVIFFAGNQYMVVPELLEAFKQANPKFQRVFAETIPPGIEERQMESGALVLGNMVIDLKPDVITAGKGSIDDKHKEGMFTQTADYAKNKLAIMVQKGNPKNIKDLKDMERPDVLVSMPNPEWEGIGDRIIKAYENTGGKELANAIMNDKVTKGTTYLTTIHHRQTPMRIMYEQSHAGPVWYSEAYYHSEMTNHPIDMVTLPDNINVQTIYSAGRMKNAPNPEAADAFMKFMVSPKAKEIYKKYGFTTVD